MALTARLRFIAPVISVRGALARLSSEISSEGREAGLEELVQRLNSISIDTSLAELKNIMKQTTVHKYPLSGYYGRIASCITNADQPDKLGDTELIVALMSKLQQGYKVEECLPGRAWLCGVLRNQISSNIHAFSPSHIAR